MALHHTEYKPFRPYSDLHGKYTPVYLIAVGGMSEIWACLNHKNGDLVAVKRLLPHSMLELTAKKSGIWEEHALRNLKHPNVLHFIEQGVDDGRICFVTELIPGMNFEHYLNRRVLTVDRFFELAIQMLVGTKAIHEAGLIHGDLKPENMMVTQGESGALILKILDFGTATLMHPAEGETNHAPTTEDLLITPEYVAPELLTGSRPSPSSDLYALGMSFYQCLAGKPCFEASDPQQILRMQIEAKPRDLRENREELPAYLCNWIMKFIEKDPARRPRSAAVAHLELSTMQRQHPMVKKMTRRTGTRRIAMPA